MSLPKTYKVQAFHEKGGKLVYEDRELKKPGPGQVLIKVRACGVCHSDSFVQGDAWGKGYPLVPGHEIIGDIAAVPEGETRWKVGDRVGSGWYGGSDGTCEACQRGLSNACTNLDINGILRDGGYAEYVIVQSIAVAKIPDDVDPAEYAPILCAGVTVFNAMRQLKVQTGELVAVQGLGGLGHQLGAHEYIDTSAEDPVKKLQELGGAKMIVATAPSPKAITPLTGGLKFGGHILLLAVAGEVPFNTVDLIVKAATISGWPSGHALDEEEAVAFTKLGGIKCLIEKFPLKDAQLAYDKMQSGDVRFRSVLVMD